jgi:hypothetical protein
MSATPMTATTEDMSRLDKLLEGCPTDRRRESLRIAAELGADTATLRQLAAATRLRRGDTAILPAGRYAHLSWGRGWARKGRGENAVWGERTEAGNFRVGPGKWVVGSNDGFRRKETTSFNVRHVQVGEQTWTIVEA